MKTEITKYLELCEEMAEELTRRVSIIQSMIIPSGFSQLSDECDGLKFAVNQACGLRLFPRCISQRYLHKGIDDLQERCRALGATSVLDLIMFFAIDAVPKSDTAPPF